MRIFKKIIATSVAALTVASAAAFAACSPDGGYGSQASIAAAEKVIEQLDKQSSKSLSVNGSVKLAGNQNYDISANVNTDNLEFDASVKTGEGYNYAFMRNLKLYALTSDKEIIDFSSVSLIPMADVGSMIEEQAKIPATLIYTVAPEIVNMAASFGNGLLLSYATAANAVAVSGKTITVDVNLAQYNEINDMLSVVDTLNATTSLGDILNNQTLSKYAKVYTELVTVEELNAYVDMALSMLPDTMLSDYGFEDGDIDYGDEEVTSPVNGYASILQSILKMFDELLDGVKPDANTSTYDYIVKILGSDELKDKINEIYTQTQENPLLTKKVTEYTIKDVVSLSGQSLTDEQINAQIAALKTQMAETFKDVTAQNCTVTSGTQTVSISEAKIVYKLDGEYNVLSQNIRGKVSVNDGEKDLLNVAVDFTISYGSEKITLKSMPAKLPEFDYGE